MFKNFLRNTALPDKMTIFYLNILGDNGRKDEN